MFPSTMYLDSSVQGSAENQKSTAKAPTTPSSNAESSTPSGSNVIGPPIGTGSVLAENTDSVSEVGSSEEFTPTLFSTPNPSSSSSSTCTHVSPTPPSITAKRNPIVNPLVTAGLVPSHLSDILTPPAETACKPKRRIIKASVLTEDEFAAMLKEKDQKEKEAAEEKEKRKVERERKKSLT